MGYCAEPTPEMGGLSVEVRRESFWLRAEIDSGRMFAPGAVSGVELLIEDIPAIRAALEQVERIAHEGGKQ